MKTIKQILVGIILIFGFIAVSNAQEIRNIEDYLKTNYTESKSQSNQDLSLNSLYYDFHSSLIINNQNIETIGNETPVIAYVDISDLKSLEAANSKFEFIEMLIVSFDYWGDNILLSSQHLSNLTNLKYIIFNCNQNYDKNNLQEIIDSTIYDGLQLFYSDVIAE